MNALQSMIAVIGRIATSIICKIDAPELDRVPRSGPVILAVNHINTLDVPMLVAQLYPRKLIGLAKIETWDDAVIGWLFTVFEAIPIRRGEVDLEAIHRCLATLAQAKILAVAPEGTRSYDGKLSQGQQGIVLLGLRSGAPILPVVHWGGETFSRNIRHLKRTAIHIRVGKPFILDPQGEKIVGRIRQEMTDEIMRQMATLMPEAYRGIYSDCERPELKYLRFL